MKIKAFAVASAMAVPALLAGCRSGYDLDLRNMTDQPVQARLVSPHQDGADMTLAETRLGPGDRGSLFKQVDGMQRVSLEVDFAGNVSYPARMDLSRGKTIVNVERADSGSKGRIALREVARP